IALGDAGYTVTAAVADHAGNPASTAARALTVDATAPSLLVSISDGEPNASETATINFVFSTPPLGFTLSDATATGGALSNLQQIDTTHFSATFTPAAATETQAAAVSVAAASYTDTAGNPGAAASSGSFSVDTVAPAIAINPFASANTVNAAEAAAGFAITGTTTAEDGQNVSVTIRDAANQTLDSFSATV